MDSIILNLYKVARLFHAKGSIDEYVFDSLTDDSGIQLFPKDVVLNGEDTTRSFTPHQYHLIHTILPHHIYTTI